MCADDGEMLYIQKQNKIKEGRITIKINRPGGSGGGSGGGGGVLARCARVQNDLWKINKKLHRHQQAHQQLAERANGNSGLCRCVCRYQTFHKNGGHGT